MPWRQIVKEAKLDPFYVNNLLQEKVDPEYLFSEVLCTDSWDATQHLKWFTAGEDGNRVPQNVHHAGTLLKVIFFPCKLLLLLYNLIMTYWTTQEEEFDEDLSIAYEVWS